MTKFRCSNDRCGVERTVDTTLSVYGMCKSCWVGLMRRVHPLEEIQLKPRTTVARFAADLKVRIKRAAVAFDQPDQAAMVAGMQYVLGIVDAALSDYDVRDPL
jgi:hypothetical protein